MGGESTLSLKKGVVKDKNEKKKKCITDTFVPNAHARFPEQKKIFQHQSVANGKDKKKKPP